MDFGVNTEFIKNLASTLKKEAANIESTIENIYRKLENLEKDHVWEGDAYKAFWADCKAFRPALNQVPEVINDFAKFFDGKVHSNADTLHTEVQNAYKEIEGA